ncbi:polyprenyl P-hydroxybenzoate and phenylacrylic acid decarboxylase family protein [Rickettsia felis str. Pedreira]|uniref:Flavin prenyltransferase UbiX n=2 Tax=Rickettsia felis TaxID=42862 RepID=A0A0F3MTY8_RICFI|nr:flavin prenyltransferase UbiX [Rickettsia felis]AAY61710.1 3-octaprenyl-4-hydroxybenzoate carboxy-lyase [Rickettsia felis URRWXCal2]KHO03032.1 aromatic acid decarboxylase [Rickettsia felis str. LSU]KHO03479.1 aromatic acid decarboxylase [Rickettsia felis]KJV59205.1 polyprenyl P-hydroxybenzoate and phenylacrylic acid decarboxylase family protein [Rickettsia felis str. Pedreira]MDE8611648.1 UbiX family flavin prenyltransferase [Rickettsia felis]
MNKDKKIIIAISGASGAIYGIRLLEVLKEQNIETHLVISEGAALTIKLETKYSIDEVKFLANYYYDDKDLGSTISSGSFKTSGMIIAPCSMKTLASIAHSMEDSLISRAAGVVLKDRRKLILMTRETPLHIGHLENMLKVANYGGIIAPPVPAFYNNPKAIDDIVNHSITRVLDFFDIETNLIKRWGSYKQ